MSLGIYISVPFCKSKCSYCNFATGVVSRASYSSYVDRLCADIAGAGDTARRVGGRLDRIVDSVFLGGGTPTILDPLDLERLFTALRRNFEVLPGAEITVECAPGTLSPPVLEALLHCGVNRVSFGVQSWIDAEAAAVGRLHNRECVLQDINHLRSAGIHNVNVDLIAGLPHQTAESWELSVAATIDCGVPHASVYMLEVDEDSRLGKELLAGGTKYHAHFVPDEDACADFYEHACQRLEEAGICQYEISNFARQGAESRHNLKYWKREPYFGFGVDAHSMLRAADPDLTAVRFAGADDLKTFVAGAQLEVTPVPPSSAIEEAFFLGLRLRRGVDLRQVSAEFGSGSLTAVEGIVQELLTDGLVESANGSVRLTASGRVLSNEVFEKFLGLAEFAT
jgi:oxygen-independent coproporphyrinogen-3 oxidase